MSAQRREPLFIVGTRFQAIMADAIRRHHDMDRYGVVAFVRGSGEELETDRALRILAQGATGVDAINRRWSTRAQLFRLASSSGFRRRLVFSAALSNPWCMALFKLNRALKLRTFDEGTYNVDPLGPFFNDTAPAPASLRAFASRALFPRGPVAYARRRSEMHYSAFPPHLNLLAEKCTQIDLGWSRYAEPAELKRFADVRSILVLPCLADMAANSRELLRAKTSIGDYDLIVRHPRDGDPFGIPSVQLSSPIESIVDAVRGLGTVAVSHYRSTVGLTLRDMNGVELHDLSKGASSERMPATPPAP